MSSDSTRLSCLTKPARAVLPGGLVVAVVVVGVRGGLVLAKMGNALLSFSISASTTYKIRITRNNVRDTCTCTCTRSANVNIYSETYYCTTVIAFNNSSGRLRFEMNRRLR